MLKNYIKIAWRNLVRNKSYSLINTIGLSVGIASCLLIFLFIQDELSYDRYHEKADRIYRTYFSFERGQKSGQEIITSAALGPALVDEMPEVQGAVRFSNKYREVLVERNQYKFYEEDFFFTDNSIFEVFSFSLLQGNPKTVLKGTFKVVITEEIAQRYFGNENPLGKTLSIKGSWGAEDYEVSGVMKNVPDNSHFNINFLTSLETLYSVYPGDTEMMKGWRYRGFFNYVLMDEGVQPEKLQDKTTSFVSGHYGKKAAEVATLKFQPLTDIHLYSDFERELGTNSDVRYIYIFGSIALLILIIAGINYMNLATARSADRALEVGIRKTLGVRRFRLMVQFLSESILFCFISVLISLFIVEALLPYFNNLTGKSLRLPVAEPVFYIVLMVILLVIGLTAGLYPALSLSRFSPQQVFRGADSGRKKSTLRNVLIVFQFSVTVILIAGTLVINSQLEHIRNKRLGLDTEHVISIAVDSDFRKSYSAFKDELLGYSDIKSITHMNRVMPSKGEQDLSLAPEGLDYRKIRDYSVGRDFLKTLAIPLKKGQSFTELSADTLGDYMPVLINEAAAAEWGWEDPIGKTFKGFDPIFRVVGVVQNFHYRSLKEQIAPLVIWPSSYARNILIRTDGQNIRETLSQIDKVWAEIGPGTTLEYSFLDDEYDSLYKAEDRLASLFESFSLLAIVIACLGLLGLAAYTAERRTKEIGIRKVLGATITNIVTLLSKDFMKLVLIGFTIAIPIAWYAMNQWLADFAYRIEIGASIFLLAGGAALLIALATVSWQSVRAAVANPVDSLRSE